MTDREPPDPAHTTTDQAGDTDTDRLDMRRPSPARVYDALLDGSSNFEADRRMAAAMLAAEPQARRWAYANRAFLRRAVGFLLDEGVRQFLDLGSGLPTVGNVHQIVQAHGPDGRVVYVDVDPVAVAHSRLLLAGDERAGVVHADIRNTAAVLADPVTRRLIDFDQPVAVLAVAVLHFLPENPGPLLERLRAAVAPGSFLAVSHLTTPADMSTQATDVVARYNTSTAMPLTFRGRTEVTALFRRWRLVEPGIVPVDTWHPDPGDDADPDGRVPIWAGVARLPRYV